jgi:hypothetical protein
VKVLLIVLAAIAALVVAVDRVADVAAGRYAAQQIERRVPGAGEVDVDFRGFPFLTQAVRRTFDAVDVTTTGARSSGVRIDRLDVRLTEARVLSQDAIRAGAVTGRAALSYAELTAAAGGAAEGAAEVAYGGDGLVKITRTVQVLGRETSVSAIGRAAVRDGVLTVQPERFEGLDGPLGEVVRRLSLGRFTVRVPVQQLPAGLDIDVNPTQNGVELRFTGTNVVLTSDALAG